MRHFTCSHEATNKFTLTCHIQHTPIRFLIILFILCSDIIETISATNYDEDDESVPVVDDLLPSPNRNDIPNSTLNNSSKSIPVAPADKNKNSLQSTNELEGDVIGQVEQVGYL